jgi:valacyclovir hydrolase
MPFADLPTGARLFYEDVGTGEPLIAIHGRLGTARTDLGDVVDWLSERFRVIGPTMRGYGQSEPKPRDFPHDFYHRDARDVLALMDVLGIERAHILGYSDGGEIALILAGIAPERCLSAVAWGAVGYFGPEIRPVVQNNYPATWMTEEEKALHGITNPDGFALEWIRAVKHMIDAGGDVSISTADRITCPLLMMLGKRDTLNPQAYGQRFIDRTRHGRLVMFETGHGIHHQQWTEFQQVLGDFYDEVTGKSNG